MDEAIHVIEDHADRLFLWDYERERGQLVTLYNKAMASQWSSVTDLDWSTPVDPERLPSSRARSWPWPGWPCRVAAARLALDWRGAGAAVAPGAPVGKS